MFDQIIKQFRKLVLAYSKATGLPAEDAVEIILPGILRMLEKELRAVKFKSR